MVDTFLQQTGGTQPLTTTASPQTDTFLQQTAVKSVPLPAQNTQATKTDFFKSGDINILGSALASILPGGTEGLNQIKEIVSGKRYVADMPKLGKAAVTDLVNMVKGIPGFLASAIVTPTLTATQAVGLKGEVNLPIIGEQKSFQKQRTELKASGGGEVVSDVIPLVQWVMAVAAGKGASTKFKEEIAPSIARKLLTDKGLPTTVSLDANTVRQYFIDDSKLAPDTRQVLKDIGLNKETARQAVKEGVSVTFPAERVIRESTKPYWDKVKNIFNWTDETITKETGKPNISGVAGQGSIEATSKVLDGTYKPEEIISKVVNSPLENTPEGNTLVKTSLEAQNKGLSVEVKSGIPTVISPVEGFKTSGEVTNVFEQAQQLKPVETPTVTGTAPTEIAKPVEQVKPEQKLLQEAKKYKSAEEFANRPSHDLLNKLNDNGIRGAEQRMAFWEKATQGMDKTPVIDSVNPTGGVYVDYNPEVRATAKLADNMTTLAETTGKSPDTMVTIYRGAPKNQKGIVAGDFITTDYNSAKSYIGQDGVILEKKVRLGDILDDKTEPLGGDYLYRPKADLEIAKSGLTPEVNPLIAEAKKYKSAEEFVKAQGTPLYHRTNAEFTNIYNQAQKEVVKPTIDISIPKEQFIEQVNQPLRDVYKNHPDQPKLGEAQMTVLGEMGVAEAGYRYQDMNGEWHGVSSTFPQWVPEELRSSKLFDKVLSGLDDLNNITYPDSSTPRRQALYDAVLNRIDEITGIDSSNIRKEIVTKYDEYRTKTKESELAATETRKRLKEVATRVPQGGERPIIPEGGPGTELKAAQKPVGEGKLRKSEAYRKVYEQLETSTREDVSYNRLNLKNDTINAINLIAKEPDKALRVGFGLEDAPAGQTETAISIALADKAGRDGNFKLQSQLESSRSLRQTRRGQEIVSERGRFNDDSPQRYMAELMDKKLKTIGDKLKSDIVKEGKEKISAKEKVINTIDKKAEELSKKIKQERKKIMSAQDLIDSLICKV